MNDIFNFRRFVKFFLKETIERKNIYLYTAIAALLILPALCLIMPDVIFETIIIFQLCMPFIMYSSVNHKKHGIAYVMLPVSPLEKLLSLLLNASIMLPFVLWLFCNIASSYCTEITPLMGSRSSALEEMAWVNSINWFNGLMLGYHSFFIIGVFSFKRFQFAKTMLVFWSTVLLFIYAMALVYFVFTLYSDTSISFPACIFTSMRDVPYSINDGGILSCILGSMMILVALAVTFFKIKEQEI